MKYVLVKYDKRVSEVQEMTEANESNGYIIENIGKSLKFTQPVMSFGNGIPDWAINNIPLQILCMSCSKPRLETPINCVDLTDALFSKWVKESRKGCLTVTDEELSAVGHTRIGIDTNGTVYTCSKHCIWIITNRTRRDVQITQSDINVILDKFL